MPTPHQLTKAVRQMTEVVAILRDIDDDQPRNTGGSESGQHISLGRFRPGHRVIVLPDNGYDIYAPSPITGPMAGYFGKVTSRTESDAFIHVELTGSTHGATANCDKADWIFYPHELAHAD